MTHRLLLLCTLLASVGCGTEGLGASVTQAQDANGSAAAPRATRPSEVELHVSRAEREYYSRLANAVVSVGDGVESRSPGTSLGIAVHVFGDKQERVEFRADTAQQSASSVKIIWAAAALDNTSVNTVMRHGKRAVITSDNCSAGLLIDLAGGVGEVNSFYTRAGMIDSGVHRWDPGCSKRASSFDPKESSNRLTARDGVAFLDELAKGSLLTPDKKEALLSWMQSSPKTGMGGWLTARLPEPVRHNSMHKAGWTDTTTNELGLVSTMSNKVYTIAILANGGKNLLRQQALVAYASCEIYQVIENSDASCE